ncbi:MAG TPA: CocE/NonD family hydrolase [Candidatus Limnocylindrales bacterium]|nr:CocE/NonD family hydrolase [Candidatus Limnocylindrales bacterium]
MRSFVLILACAAALAGPHPTASTQSHVSIPMRDGVRLFANVYLPAGRTRGPAILVRTPYGKGVELPGNWQALLDHGYAVVVEDVRGRYESEGAFEPLTQETNDGDDTLNWVARQPWCDGKIGMTGGSYLGIAQWKAAATGNPHLKAILPVVSGDDDYRDRFYSQGGAMKLGNRLEWLAENMKAPGYHPDFQKFIWHLPLRTSDIAATGWPIDLYREALAHPAYDSYWRGISTREHLASVHAPVFAVSGWYDNFVESDLDAFAALRKNGGLARILIGPWPHNMSIKFPGVDFGPEADAPVRSLAIEWFDQWLMGKDTPLLSQPPVKVFLMGANRWREAREWPPRDAHPRSFYLDANGTLASKPSAAQARDRYTYDPRNPVPTIGGAVCCNPKVFPWGPMDQRPVEKRPDVVVYSTEPLKQDLEVVGPVKAVLWISTSARDTDFTAKLIDVFPDGTARNLTDGILRLRYRNSLEHAELAVPGQIYQIAIDAGVTGNVFLKGHRLRVEISSSNFPRFDRNLNTGTAISGETTLLKAIQTIYHDRAHPSRLEVLAVN